MVIGGEVGLEGGGFVFEDIEAGTEDVAGGEAGGDGGIGADGPSRGVDEIEGVAHAVEKMEIEIVVSVGRLGDMEGEDLGLGLDVGQGALGGMGGGDAMEVAVIGQDAAAEAGEAAGKGGTGVAKADDAHGEGAEFGAAIFGSEADAGADLAVGSGDVMEQGKEHGGGVFGHSGGIGLGRIEQGDAAVLTSGDVNIFHAGACPGDEAEGGCVGEQGGIDREARAYDQAISGGEKGVEGGAGLGVCVGDGVAGSEEALLEDGVDGVEKKNVHAHGSEVKRRWADSGWSSNQR